MRDEANEFPEFAVFSGFAGWRTAVALPQSNRCPSRWRLPIRADGRLDRRLEKCGKRVAVRWRWGPVAPVFTASRRRFGRGVRPTRNASASVWTAASSPRLRGGSSERRRNCELRGSAACGSPHALRRSSTWGLSDRRGVSARAMTSSLSCTQFPQVTQFGGTNGGRLVVDKDDVAHGACQAGLDGSRGSTAARMSHDADLGVAA